MTQMEGSAFQEEFLSTTNGLRIFVRSWKPDSAPRAIVVICHGVDSHGGQYLWAAEKFVQRGFVVYTLDLRGRGKSDGPRFYVDNIADYVADLGIVIDLAKSRDANLPVFLLGHSAGGIVSCTYALEMQDGLAGLICESFAFKVPVPNFILGITKFLSGFFPRLPVLKLKNEDFSRDGEAVRVLNADPLIANEVQPAATVAALVRADERLKQEFPSIKLPVLILHGTADTATVPSGSEFFYKTAGSEDKTLKLYEGHFHDLLNDLGKERVLDDMVAWIDTRLPERVNA
jgi:acylglycerol lipase